MNRPRRQRAVTTAAFLLALLVSVGTGSSVARSAAAVVSPVGDWASTYSHCTSGWCNGQDFANPTTITQFDPKTGAFSGTDAGSFTVTGHMSGASFSMTVTNGSYTAEVKGTISGDKWTGDWTDNNGVGGTWTGSRKPTHAGLEVSVTLSASSGNVGVGDTFTAKVKVTAADGDVKGISLGDGLSPSSGAVKITDRPDGTTGFDLSSGSSRTFSWKLDAVKAGEVKLTARASGDDESGDTVNGFDTATLSVGAKALAITIETTPRKLKLELDDKGKIKPGKVTVKVTITNTTKSKITGVQLLSLRPVPTDLTLPLDQLGFAKDALPVKLGTFPAKSKATRTFELEVTGDGEYELKALVLYDDRTAKGGNGRETGTGGTFEAVVPPLWYSAKRDADNITENGNAAVVKGGKTWYVTAQLKNVSTYKRLCILPMAPSLAGNAGATGPVDIAKRDLRSIGGPFAGVLEPGKDVTLSMFVDTATNGSTRSTVTLKPTAVELKRDGSCDAESVKGLKPLGAADETIKPDSEEFKTTVDLSVPLKDNGGIFSNTFNFFGGMTQAVVVDTFEQIGGMIALAHSASSIPQEYGLLGQVFPQAAYAFAGTKKAAQMIYTAGQVYADYWHYASQSEKDGLLAKVGNVLQNVSGDFFKQGTQTVREAAVPFLDELEQAYATSDDAKIWHLWGEVGGHAVQQIVLAMFTEVTAAEVVRNQAAFEQIAARATAKWKASPAVAAITEDVAPQAVSTSDLAGLAEDTTLYDVPAGAELTDKDIVLWGQDAVSDAEFARISKECECLIGVRSRSKDAITKLENGSVWKHENLKPKNVNEIDVKYLGFREADLSEVRFRTYTPEQENVIRARVAAAQPSLDAEEYRLLVKRMNTRFGEYKYVDPIEGFSKRGQINVGFNYRDNGINLESTSKLRKFDLQSTAIPAEDGLPAGGTYYTPFQENPAAAKAFKRGGKLPKDCIEKLLSILCTVTGDMDGVYITDLNGGPLPKDKMVKVYGQLQEAGWQHPETTTWTAATISPEAAAKGQTSFLFDKKSEILDELQYGKGQAMIEYAPDGTRRATYLDLAESKLLTRDDWLLRVVGGFTDVVKVAN